MATRFIHSRRENENLGLDDSEVEDETEEKYGYKTYEYPELDRRQFDPEIGRLLEVVEDEIDRYPNSNVDGRFNIRELYGSMNQTDEEMLLADPQELLEQAIENSSNRTKIKSCADCSVKKRVSDVNCLRKGQHISISGELGKFYSATFQKQIKLYSHHAIVKQVVSSSGQRVKLLLIHFWRDNESESEDNGDTSKDSHSPEKVAIRETPVTFDLKYDELYIVEYAYPRYSPDQIVARAEQEKEKKHKFSKYCFLSNNCEHFATWCIAGKDSSFQVQDASSKLSSTLSTILGEGSKIAGYILRVIRSLKDVALVSADEIATVVKSAAGGISLGIIAGLYLIYCIVMTGYYVKKYTDGNLCVSCLKSHLLKLWLRFIAFSVTSTVSYLIIHFALPLLPLGASIPIVIIMLILCTAVMLIVPWAVKKVQSPIQLKENKISALTELHRGDIVNFKYYKIPHYFIVSDVEQNPHPLTCGKVKCIHYSLPKIFGTRVVTEEDFDIDLNKIVVKKINYGNLNTHSGTEVVRRARKRIGETKFNAFSNRSDHLCHWAKVKASIGENIYPPLEEKDDSKTRPLSSLFIETKQVHLMEEIQRGDVVQLKGTQVFRDKGILVKLTDLREGRKFQMQIIMLKDRVKLVNESVDLNKDKLFLKRYHPAHCVPLEKRAERALDMVDKVSERCFQSGFIRDCILIDP